MKTNHLPSTGDLVERANNGYALPDTVRRVGGEAIAIYLNLLVIALLCLRNSLLLHLLAADGSERFDVQRVGSVICQLYPYDVVGDHYCFNLFWANFPLSIPCEDISNDLAVSLCEKGAIAPVRDRFSLN